MNEEHNIHLPADADDLSKHAPVLFSLKNTEAGFVVPALYFEELSELVISKTAIPQEGGLVVAENYFEELASIVEAKTLLPAEDGLVVPEQYFEELPSLVEAKTAIPSEDGLVVPEQYFEAFAAQLGSQIALQSILPEQEGEIPEEYFRKMQDELRTHIVLDNVKQDEGFVVPPQYFEQLTESVLGTTVRDKDEIHTDEVPAGYFDSLHDEVLVRLENEGTIEKQEERGRVIVLSQWKKYAAATAVAASVALLVGLAWTFRSDGENGNGSLVIAAHTSAGREKGVRIVQEETTAAVLKKSEAVKPVRTPEVIMNDDEIIAQSDLMDEALVMDFVSESNVIEATEEALDPAMMEYLMNDNTSLDVFDPGYKK
jgi:hypothetical protein